MLDVVADQDGTGARILVHVSGPAVAATGIASGFSGSPVYCPDAHGVIGNAGAISATIGQYGEDVGLVTPIEQMLACRSSRRAACAERRSCCAPRARSPRRSCCRPLAVARPAAAAHRARARARARRRARRAARHVPAAAAVPGASLAVGLSTGAVAAGAIGTVTYRDGDVVYGFGHPLEGAGRRALLLQDAYVFTVVANPLDTRTRARTSWPRPATRSARSRTTRSTASSARSVRRRGRCR